MVVVEAEIEILEFALDFVVVETVGPNFAVGVAVPILVVAETVDPNFAVGVAAPILVVAALVRPIPSVVGVGMAISWRKRRRLPGRPALYGRSDCSSG